MDLPKSQPSFCGVQEKEKTNGIHHSSEMVAEFNAANPTCSTLYFPLPQGSCLYSLYLSLATYLIKLFVQEFVSV
ncbi:hypothetical protein SDJN03_20385, partial [Cucurbita argyrosperma subsp. sororia]